MSTLRVVARSTYHFFACMGMVTLLVLFTPVVSWWARAYAGPIDRPSGDILIVLSAAADDEGVISYSSYWRARMAASAWKSGHFKQVVVSGASGPGILDFLEAEGVPANVIVPEWRSRSTHDNALEAARILRNVPGTKVLLTSDFHMYRALRVFRKAGIQVTPMAVPDVLHSAENWSGRFCGFETMLIETAKIVDYEVHGWI